MKNKRATVLYIEIVVTFLVILVVFSYYTFYNDFNRIKKDVESIDSVVNKCEGIEDLFSVQYGVIKAIDNCLMYKECTGISAVFKKYTKFLESKSSYNFYAYNEEIYSLYKKIKRAVGDKNLFNNSKFLLDLRNETIILNEKLMAIIYKNRTLGKESIYALKVKINSIVERKLLLMLLVVFILITLIYTARVKLLKIYSAILVFMKELSSKNVSFFKDEKNMEKMKFELGAIYPLFAEVSQMISNFIAKLRTSGIELSKIVLLISEATKQQSSSISEQAASVNQLTASIEELSITAKEIADIAKRVDESATETRKTAKDGVNLIVKVIDSVEGLKDSINVTAQKNVDVVKKSKEIDRILEFMENVVSEIHLLALNASIESASAGEFGKRFGAIAQEIRELANNSQESIERIKEHVFGFHEVINSAVMSIEYSKKEVDKTKKTVEEAGEHFERIFANIEETNIYSKQISAATEQQKIAGEQIVNVIRDINSTLNVSSTEIEKVNQSLNKLLEISLVINGIVQSFKIEDKLNVRNIVEELISEECVKRIEIAEMEKYFESVINFNPFLEIIYMVDKRGIWLTGKAAYYVEFDTKPFQGKDFSQRNWFKGAIEEGGLYITEPYISLATNELCITFSSPVYNEKGEIIAVLGVDVNYKRWIEEI